MCIRDRHSMMPWEHVRRRGSQGFARGRSGWVLGAIAAAFYGAAIGGTFGAAAGLAFWAATGALVVAYHRYRAHHRPSPGPATEAELFEQLRTSPCALCGAPTLLDVCLDCTDGPSH